LVDEASADFDVLASEVGRSCLEGVEYPAAPRLGVACLAAINVQRKEEFLAI
jgi:hypothetical protein